MTTQVYLSPPGSATPRLFYSQNTGRAVSTLLQFGPAWLMQRATAATPLPSSPRHTRCISRSRCFVPKRARRRAATDAFALYLAIVLVLIQ